MTLLNVYLHKLHPQINLVSIIEMFCNCMEEIASWLFDVNYHIIQSNLNKSSAQILVQNLPKKLKLNVGILI